MEKLKLSRKENGFTVHDIIGDMYYHKYELKALGDGSIKRGRIMLIAAIEATPINQRALGHNRVLDDMLKKLTSSQTQQL